jgi:hypothetical protein
LRETPDMRIVGVIAIVAHHEVTAGGNTIRGTPFGAWRDIRALRIEL